MANNVYERALAAATSRGDVLAAMAARAQGRRDLAEYVLLSPAERAALASGRVPPALAAARAARAEEERRRAVAAASAPSSVAAAEAARAHMAATIPNSGLAYRNYSRGSSTDNIRGGRRTRKAKRRGSKKSRRVNRK